jgi:hypothetical protein
MGNNTMAEGKVISANDGGYEQQHQHSEDVGYVTPPHGPKVLGIRLPAYRSPIVQTLIVSFVQLLVVGMFNVLAALGGGGQVNATTSNNANTILYALFAAFSLLAGSVTNYLGPKWTLATGGVGYSLLAASYWCYNHTKNKGVLELLIF